MLEVVPGVSLPLKPVSETWKAIKQGQITSTKCIQCQEDLTCGGDLRLVICGDCWTINVVDQSSASDNHDIGEDSDDSLPLDPNKDHVGLGVKNREIVAWMEDGCRESFSI